MNERRLRRVTLSGDLAGEYVVIEERDDGTLVIARASGGTAPAPPRTESRFGTLGRMFRRSRTTNATVPELLAGWGIQLRGKEEVEAFLTADVDGTPGFLALTTERLIFVPHGGAGTSAVQVHARTALRGVEPIRQGLSHALRIDWGETASLITRAGPAELARLHDALSG
jgi:hypothetical protein